MDPIAGPCGNTQNLFIDPPAYDTTLTVWESGLHLKENLGINELRERITTIQKPYSINTDSDSLLYFWSHLYGLRKDKELSIKWYTPDNEEWFEYSFILDQDYWYYYYWSFIDHTNLAMGDWTVRFFYDGNEIASENFIVTGISSTTEQHNDHFCKDFDSVSFDKISNMTDINFQIFHTNGQRIPHRNLSKNPTGIYLLQIQKDNKSCIVKKWIE